MRRLVPTKLEAISLVTFPIHVVLEIFTILGVQLKVKITIGQVKAKKILHVILKVIPEGTYVIIGYW